MSRFDGAFQFAIGEDVELLTVGGGLGKVVGRKCEEKKDGDQYFLEVKYTVMTNTSKHASTVHEGYLKPLLNPETEIEINNLLISAFLAYGKDNDREMVKHLAAENETLKKGNNA